MNADQKQPGTPQQVRKVSIPLRDNDIPVVFCESTVTPRLRNRWPREPALAMAVWLFMVDKSSAQRGARAKPILGLAARHFAECRRPGLDRRPK